MKRGVYARPLVIEHPPNPATADPAAVPTADPAADPAAEPNDIGEAVEALGWSLSRATRGVPIAKIVTTVAIVLATGGALWLLSHTTKIITWVLISAFFAMDTIIHACLRPGWNSSRNSGWKCISSCCRPTSAI